MNCHEVSNSDELQQLCHDSKIFRVFRSNLFYRLVNTGLKIVYSIGDRRHHYRSRTKVTDGQFIQRHLKDPTEHENAGFWRQIKSKNVLAWSGFQHKKMDQQVLFDSGENPKLADPVFRKWWVSAAYLFSEGFRPLVTSAPKERNQRKQKSWDINVAGGILRRGPWSAELQTKNSDQLAKTKTCSRPKSSVLLVRPFSVFDWNRTWFLALRLFPRHPLLLLLLSHISFLLLQWSPDSIRCKRSALVKTWNWNCCRSFFPRETFSQRPTNLVLNTNLTALNY